jgi:hypothetical protein
MSDTSFNEAVSASLLQINKTVIQHAVRQVMMNEMGLSREFIRNQAEELIKETIRKQADAMINTDRIDKLIVVEINKMLRHGNPYASNVEGMVAKEIQSRVAQMVKDKLAITFALKD